MRFLLPVLALSAAVSITCVAQDQAATTLRTNVRLTTVDVVVTDGKGNPVTGLKQDDFTIRERKQPQRILTFEEHKGENATYDSPRPGVFTNATAARGGVSNVILMDWLNTPPTDQRFMRDQLVKFVLAQKPGTRTAIFGMNSSVVLLQDFTADPVLLRRALQEAGTSFSPLVSQLNSGPDPVVTALENKYEATPVAELREILAGLMQTANDRHARTNSVLVRNRALDSMSCLREVARYLKGVNGRKNLLWVSASFPSIVQREADTTGKPFEGDQSMEPELRQTQNLLASSQVALYPVDPRGLPTPPSQLPSSDSDTYGDPSRQQRMSSSNSFNPVDKQFDTDTFREHTTMEELADATGGKAYFNTNDIAGALEQAINDASHYYTLTYTPPLDAKPNQFRDIAVTARGKGMHLSYRKGYYTPVSNAGEPTPLNSKQTALSMQSKAPQSGEVLFQIEVSKPVAVNNAKIIGGPVFEGLLHNTYQLDALVDFSTLHFSPDADGKMHGVIDVATVIYDKAGKVLDSRSDRANLTLDEARYQAMLKGGMKYHQLVAVPDKGDGYVRVAVHDAMTDKLGTVQISMANLRTAAAP